jgi:hypothetical protein
MTWGMWRRSAVAAGLILALLLVGPVSPAWSGPLGPIIIGNDRGGPIEPRALEVDRLRAFGARVEIRGNICYSACTMYLGAGDVCVSPKTTFGFHGPTAYSGSLAPDSFDHWSEVMSRYYSAPLRSWFMEDARFVRAGVVRVTGAELIRLGYSPC